jgi:CubicO group peptidase (beta-lactamase class C family)
MIRDRIFYPLKMNETYTDIKSALSSSGNISIPHRVNNGIIAPAKWEDYGVYSPAEGIYSNVMDLSNWVKLQLNNGTFENKSIIKSETLINMQNPQTIASNIFKVYFNPEANIMAMGLGWFISDYKGYKVIQMAGSSPGTTNLISMIPAKKTSIIIQSNKGGAFSSFVPINYWILNNLFSQ